MSAEIQLAEAYDRWEALALTEAEAIRARDWARLATCQEELRLLQPQIDDRLAQARAEWCGPNPASGELHFRARVQRLQELAQRNQRLLEETCRLTIGQRDRLEQARHTLRRVRASYCPPTPAAWSSFS